MTLAELQAEVYILTNRPDLTAETQLAVRQATLKLHQFDYFYKDLYETGISFADSTLTLQQVEYRTLLPRWRSLKYLRKFDATATPAPGLAGIFFEIINPLEAVDSYLIHQENVCYVAGEILQIRSNDALGHCLLGVYLHPDIAVATYDANLGFIAKDHPYAIVYEAAATVLRIIGKQDEASQLRMMCLEEMKNVQANNILEMGY